MTPDPELPFVPLELCGKWIAWTRDGLQIVGSGDLPEEAELQAKKGGVDSVILEWVPPADEIVIGSIR